MSDKLVFDLAQEVEGSPNVFVRKDWLNILDNQNQNYNNNQSVIDTSQLSNSNKYMSYREAYFSIPFLMTLGSTGYQNIGAVTDQFTVDPTSNLSSIDMSIGLKSWFGQIIHSFTLDYNGTTIIQQTPYVNMWNSFKLMTSLSLDDVNTQGATIGFFPDDPYSWQFTPAATAGLIAIPATTSAGSILSGTGVCNNTNFNTVTAVYPALFSYKSGGGNEGLLFRQQLVNFDVSASTGIGSTYSTLLSGAGIGACNSIWKSYISQKQRMLGAAGPAGAITQAALLQVSIVATVYLKHIHSFFNMCPLLKGVFMKMTMNLNNTTTEFKATSSFEAAAAGPPIVPEPAVRSSLLCSSVLSPLGGVNPAMIASGIASNGSIGLFPSGQNVTANAGSITYTYRLNLSVGASCLDAQLANLVGVAQSGALSKSVYLYIPAYTFNPVFEQAYLSSPVKQIKYTDIYQYQVLGVSSDSNFNNLLTNGIANVKSVLILPYYSTSYPEATAVAGALPTGFAGQLCSDNTGFTRGLPVFQSPFDPAGTGPTSPMCWLTNFNVQVSGQNAIYNLQRYGFEQFNNQLYGQNAVNGGLTDGLTSGLIDRGRFDMEYSYYYVNIERMLPVEMSVPKSIQILGQNKSSKSLDLYCFIEYGVDISIDSLTGARV